MLDMMPKQLTREQDLQINADQSSETCIFCLARNLKWVPTEETRLRALPTHQGVIQVATVAGDPDKPGWLTMRMRIPPNYHVPPHYHPHAETELCWPALIICAWGKNSRRRTPTCSSPAICSSSRSIRPTSAGQQKEAPNSNWT
jgi:hypothetical protein